MQDFNLNEQGHVFLLLLPHMYSLGCLFGKGRKHNLPWGGSTEQSGDSEVLTTFIKAENTVG